jgi:hypothetical protein
MSNIGSILATVLKIVWRWLCHSDDPQVKYEKAKQENAKIITTGDQDAINRKLDVDTDKLDRVRNNGDYPVQL